VRVVFLGTPAPASQILERVVEAGHEVVQVITRPDAKRGRGGALSPSPVKETALRLGIPVAHQLDVLDTAEADVGVVVAYGALIPASRLEKLPMLNVHFSLLPRWRGAAPVERCILAGDEETGVDIMTLEPTLDTGPIHFEVKTLVGDKDATELLSELTRIGGDALVRVLTDPALLKNASPQSGEATYAAKLSASDFVISPELSASDAMRIIRLGRTRIQTSKGTLRILKARPANAAAAPGEILRTDGKVFLGLADGALELLELRPEGSKSMTAESWWTGVREVTVQWSSVAISGE